MGDNGGWNATSCQEFDKAGEGRQHTACLVRGRAPTCTMHSFPGADQIYQGQRQWVTPFWTVDSVRGGTGGVDCIEVFGISHTACFVRGRAPTCTMHSFPGADQIYQGQRQWVTPFWTVDSVRGGTGGVDCIEVFGISHTACLVRGRAPTCAMHSLVMGKQLQINTP